ncbi:hypothetical protein [Aestuariivivens sediminis]|uniref:hypothetical protein n=1 Tax=Aestuariivivens sediminis TaxID=2913557 RepID=UPI001F58AD89|nr:hypothetical protein [Aestuariivivens sediminis]
MKGLIKKPFNAQTIGVTLLLILCCGACKTGTSSTEKIFIKGVYGDPATLLQAGYTFNELGVNALFVRSYSLNDELYNAAREQGCKVFVEFPVLLGRQFIEDHPQCQPRDTTGQASPPADWFMGVCPTCPDFKADRRQHLKRLLNQFKVDGIFLDYLHWHAQFETPEPILPETCFCERCTALFSKKYKIEIPQGNSSDRSHHILSFHEREWRDWRRSILTDWIRDLKQILKSHQPESALGLFYCAWYPDEYDAALYRILGIDINDFAREADILAPMLFHHMTDRPVRWIGEYTTWLDSVCHAIRPEHKPEIWPIVQAHNTPGEVSPAEFREAMLQGRALPSSGIMMFSDRALLQDPRKLEIMKSLYVVDPE